MWGVLFMIAPTLAQPKPTVAQEATDSLRLQLARLAALVDSLSLEVARLRGEGEDTRADDALARLREAAQAAASAGASPEPQEPDTQDFVGRQRSLQALNPEISVNADLFGHASKDDPDADNFFAREFEISIISNLDPFSRAKIFLSRHYEGGEFSPFANEDQGGAHDAEEGGGFSVEEGYVEWVSLPGGIGLKFGKFFQQFGQLNRWHAHALPFQTRSLPHLAFVGEGSLAQTGLSAHWLAPFALAGSTFEATVEVTRSENEKLFGESTGISLLSHVNAFWSLSTSTDLDLGFSWLSGSYERETVVADRNLYGLEMAFTWRPPGQSRYRGFSFRGGVMAVDGLPGLEQTSDADAEGALGLWASGDLRLSQNWLVGGRFDRTENPVDPDETAWLFSPTLTWWQSEYVRLRLEYDLLGRSFATEREGHFLFQVTFAMGPHKHETY